MSPTGSRGSRRSAASRSTYAHLTEKGTSSVETSGHASTRSSGQWHTNTCLSSRAAALLLDNSCGSGSDMAHASAGGKTERLAVRSAVSGASLVTLDDLRNGNLIAAGAQPATP